MNEDKDVSTNNIVKKILFFISFLFFIAYISWLIVELGWMDILKEQEQMQGIIKNLGLIGPFAIISLIAMAIVISPIPSAPIALVSGALYGHTMGTIYVVIGAVTGALIAFLISRKLGYAYINKKLHHQVPVKIIGSQNTLMLIVFVSRLAPFISFDVISYAAGLTRLTAGRFLLATIAGIIPISFLLAHFGSEAANGEIQEIVFSLFFLGLLSMSSMLYHSFKKSRK